MEPLQPEYRNVHERDRKAEGQRRQVESPGTPAQQINQVADERRHAGRGKKNRLQPDEARRSANAREAKHHSVKKGAIKKCQIQPCNGASVNLDQPKRTARPRRPKCRRPIRTHSAGIHGMPMYSTRSQKMAPASVVCAISCAYPKQ